MALRKARNAKYARAPAKSSVATRSLAFGDRSVVDRAVAPCAGAATAPFNTSSVANAADPRFYPQLWHHPHHAAGAVHHPVHRVTLTVHHVGVASHSSARRAHAVRHVARHVSPVVFG